MKKIIRFSKIIILDILGAMFMIAALLTGWLPGPGGIPLFIIGLSLLAINHEWAERHIDTLKEHADRLGDLIFIEKPAFQRAYDVAAPLCIIAGLAFLYHQGALWMLGIGVFLTFLGVTFFLGNRHRYREYKKKLLRHR